MLTKRLKDKIVIVTGAGSGIGKASALAFCRQGAKVIVSDIQAESGEETVRLIRDAGGEAVFIKSDISNAAEVEALVNRTVEIYGRLDCAHNNAGIQGDKSSIISCTEENWDSVMDVNLKGTWLCMKYEIPQMLKQGNGAIVNSASALGLVGRGGYPPYIASKHGIVGVTKSAALTYAKEGIRVNAVCPGPIDTPLHQEVRILAAGPGITDEVPMGRKGYPEEVAEVVVWLCSDAASYVTGLAMPIDGGWVAQ